MTSAADLPPRMARDVLQSHELGGKARIISGVDKIINNIADLADSGHLLTRRHRSVTSAE
jgi:hypothetical protein